MIKKEEFYRNDLIFIQKEFLTRAVICLTVQIERNKKERQCLIEKEWKRNVFLNIGHTSLIHLILSLSFSSLSCSNWIFSNRSINIDANFFASTSAILLSLGARSVLCKRRKRKENESQIYRKHFKKRNFLVNSINMGHAMKEIYFQN